MTSTRCKFECTVAEEFRYGPNDEVNLRVKLEARYCPEVPDDDRYSKYTPTGEMTFTVTNPNVVGLFEVGKQYYIDISPVQPTVK